MGIVKDSIKGSGKPKKRGKPLTDENILTQISDLREEISRLTSIKDDDADTEGAEAHAENVRKAASLRAVHSLLTAVERLLEGY